MAGRGEGSRAGRWRWGNLAVGEVGGGVGVVAHRQRVERKEPAERLRAESTSVSRASLPTTLHIMGCGTPFTPRPVFFRRRLCLALFHILKVDLRESFRREAEK
jgi:hypothetical protein